jgi:hypothetical protein
MPKYIAATEIRHGKDDGSTLTIAEGSEVKGLPPDVMRQLAEVGSIREEVKTPERREAPGEPSDMEKELREQLAKAQEDIATLKAQLSAAKTAPSK